MKKWLTAPALLAATALTACGGADDASSDYIASMYPAAFLLERITGEEVGTLTPAGADPHDLELTPRQTGRVHDASLVVTIGAIQPAVDDVVDELDTDRVLDLRDAVELRESDHEGHGHDEDEAHEDEDDHAHDEDDDHAHEDEAHEDEDDHAHDEDDDHAHEDEAHEDEDDHAHDEDDHAHDEDDDHDHGPEDPHFWTDPTLMIDAAEAITERLSEMEPDRAGEFRTNADALITELQDLDQAFTDGLAQCERRTFVTSHQAFGYLAERYDLEEISIAGINTSDEASPATVARVVDEIRDSGVTTVFAERLAGLDNARTVAEEADVEVAVLDPIEGLTEETADRDYLSLMNENLEALRAAGDCT